MRIPKLADNFDYWDLRIEDSNAESLDIEDNFVKSLLTSNTFSAGLRVVKNGSWAFASSDNPDLKELFRNVLKISRVKGVKFSLPDINFANKGYKTSFKKDPFNESAEEKISRIKLLNKNIKSRSEFIKSSQTTLLYDRKKTRFLNSSGSDFSNEYLKTRYLTRVVASRNGSLQQAIERNYTTGGLESFYKNLGRIPESVGERVIRLLNAKHAPPGKFKVVCDNEMSGVFFHEAVGHACEADDVLMNASVLKGKIGEKVASDIVTFFDYKGPGNSFGYVPVDDEGVKKKKTVLIRDGVLKSYLHSLHTASVMGVEPTGNGRGMTAHSFPIPRMTTLKIKEGSFKEEELIIELGEGVLVKGFKGGVVSPTEGKFTFGASEAFMVKKGEITVPLRDLTISGSIGKTMHKISGISKKSYLNNGGVCGKFGQRVPVNEVMPWMKIDEVIIGGRLS